MVRSMMHPLASLDAEANEIPVPSSPRPILVVIKLLEPAPFGDGCQSDVAKVWLPSAGCPTRRSRECTCHEEEIAMARVPTRARSAPIKSDRIPRSKALRTASAGRNRCTEERNRPVQDTYKPSTFIDELKSGCDRRRQRLVRGHRRPGRRSRRASVPAAATSRTHYWADEDEEPRGTEEALRDGSTVSPAP